MNPNQLFKETNYDRTTIRTVILSEGATKLALSILQTAKRPDKALQHGKYFGVSGTTKLSEECIERIIDTPDVQSLLADRPSLEWPSLEQMADDA